MNRKIIGNAVGTTMNPQLVAQYIENGKSAYQIAVDNGFKGSEQEWLESLKGTDGKDGQDGSDGYTPQKNVDYFDGAKGDKGDKGDPFTYDDFTIEQLEALKGKQGDKGDKGEQGDKGDAFKYEDFTPEQLAALKGADGKDGSDYILTESDKTGIAEQASQMVKIPEVNLDGYATEEFVKNKIAEAELGGEEVDLSGYAQKSEIPTKTSQLQNDSGYLTEHQDISGKLDVTELPAAINTALAQAKASGEFKGDTGEQGIQGIQGIQGKKGDAFTYEDFTDEQLKALKGADGKDGENGKDYILTDSDKQFIAELAADEVNLSSYATQDYANNAASSAVSTHNTNIESHNDIRLELKAINDRLNAFFDSDDKTLDELSEIVTYITNNKTLIDSITTSKVNVEDIINNLTTNVANKPLSAAQGVTLKGLIDNISSSLSNYQPKGNYTLKSELPTKVSQLSNDSGYLTEHQDISGKLDNTAEVQYVINENIIDDGTACVIEDTNASVSANDNSVYFNKQYIVVDKDTYKLDKEAMLSLQTKKLTGNGSVAWNGWDTQPQGWKDSEDATMLSSKLKVRYSDDPIYMSMKLPAEANISCDTLVRPLMRPADASGTYTKLDNMGAIYPVDYTQLPDDVVVCIGHLSMYTLSNEKNAKWKLIDKQVFPFGQSMFYLPWSSSGDQRVNISSSKITTKDDHVRFALKRDDFAPSSSVSGSIAKCLHFWGQHPQLDLNNNRAVICLFEIWTESPNAIGNLYASLGCDQKSDDLSKVSQLFASRRVLLSTEKQTIIGHNISDALYDELRDTPNDPRIVYADYSSSFSSEYDSSEKIAKHNSDDSAHPDIREEISTYMGDMQSQIGQVKEVIQEMEIIIPSLNLNDGVWEAGYFGANGTHVAGTAGQSFRNTNYLSVEGGRTIAIYYDADTWNNNNKGKGCYVVQYDINKNIIVERTTVNPYVVNDNHTLTLNANTKYIRISHNKWADLGQDLSTIKIAIYYIEDVVKEFIEYGFGSEMVYGVTSDSVYVLDQDGAKETLTDELNKFAKKSDLNPMVDEALAQAKASGEFKGDKGDKGDSGATGATGANGISATHSWSGTTLSITTASGTSSANLKGEKGDKGETGASGTNGISVTHSWNGTTLTVTSASGTSSANLKGEKGDKGDAGTTGATGKTAYKYAQEGGYAGAEAGFSQRLASLETIIQQTEVPVLGINLNDGVYEYGRFATAGTDYSDSPNNQSFRNANYLPVEGGRTITLYTDAYEWNNNNKTKPFNYVEYDSNKTIIGQRKSITLGATGVVLDANTAYVRFSMAKYATVSTPLTDIKFAIYYVENFRQEFVEYGYDSEVTYAVPSDTVYLVSPNGTKFALKVADDGTLSVKEFGS